MTKFLLPCECGESVSIEIKQAGQIVSCACGRELQVPTMRGIRELAPADDAEAAVVRSWSLTQGALFGCGVPIALIGLFIGGYYYRLQSQIDLRRPSDQDIEQWIGVVDEWSTEQLWAFWGLSQEVGLPPTISPYVTACRYVARLRMIMWTGVGIACLGIALTLSSFLLIRRAPPGG